MQLSQVIKTDSDIAITGVTADSRAVRAGYLFAALPGSKEDGAKFIGDALMHGASVILAKEGTALPAGTDAILITDVNPRRKLAEIAAAFYGVQPQNIVAVTGTSGKTSTVSFAQQLWTLGGIEKSATLGTLGIRAPGMNTYGSLTTPDTVSLHANLADLAAAGISHLAMEASSHGLDQFRLDGVRISAAGYSNLSRDHLDYHPDMDAYFIAKSRLFTDVMEEGGIAVINADDAYAQKLSELCKAAGKTVWTYGQNGTDIRLISSVPQPHGQAVQIEVFGAVFGIVIPLVGHFQVMNALLALGLVLAGDKDAAKYVPLLEKLEGVPGRLQLVPGHPEGAAIYVDYAHKPAALEAILNTLRPHTEKRLVCLVGCGGNRDAGKRPIMGRIAAGLSDLVVITDDNPRHEDAAVIRAAMMEGAPDATEIAGRGKAIQWAIAQLHEGDVLVIAGKGHETGQIIGDTVEPFDDVIEARNAIEKLGEKV